MLNILRRLFGEPEPQPIDDTLWNATFARIPWLNALTPAERERLREYSARFLSSKRFFGAAGLEIDPPMALTIAMLACWPVLHLGFAELRGWSSVIVYPGQFRVNRRDHDELTGVVSEHMEDRAGEAWERGPLILSWADIEEDLEWPDDGMNVVVHEIAHKLDERGGGVNGVPRLPRSLSMREWVTTFQSAFNELGEQIENGREDDSLIDPYAGSAPEEFFAVCSEYLFCRPDLLREQFPDVEALLRRFYSGEAA